MVQPMINPHMQVVQPTLY